MNQTLTTAQGLLIEDDAVFQIIKRTDIDPREVEHADAHVAEITVRWDRAVLAVEHIARGACFELCAGETSTRGAKHFIVDESLLGGRAAFELVRPQGEGFVCALPPGASATLERGGVTAPVDAGTMEVPVADGATLRVALGTLTLVVRTVRRPNAVLRNTRRDPALRFALLGAACAALAVVGGVHAAMPSADMVSVTDESDRMAVLRDFVQRVEARREVPPTGNAGGAGTQGADSGPAIAGQRSAGAQGQSGARNAPVRSARYAILNRGLPPQMARTTAREAVSARGIFAAMGAPAAVSGGTSGMVSPWGGMTESGNDSTEAHGNLTGDAIGNAFGYGGLGEIGNGIGGGGDGLGTVGLDRLGTIGGRGASCDAQCQARIGSGSRIGSIGSRGSHGPIVRTAQPDVIGEYPRDAIRRVVLRNLGQVSHCHEQGLAQNPQLEGRVVVRFVIGTDGTVMGSGVQESSVQTPAVASCIATAVRRWQFMPPGGAPITVNYPFTLQRAN